MKYYMANIVEKQQKLAIGVKIVMNWADGMIGACAVFADKEKAEKYAGKGRVTVFEVEPKSNGKK